MIISDITDVDYYVLLPAPSFLCYSLQLSTPRSRCTLRSASDTLSLSQSIILEPDLPLLVPAPVFRRLKFDPSTWDDLLLPLRQKETLSGLIQI